MSGLGYRPVPVGFQSRRASISFKGDVTRQMTAPSFIGLLRNTYEKESMGSREHTRLFERGIWIVRKDFLLNPRESAYLVLTEALDNDLMRRDEARIVVNPSPDTPIRTWENIDLVTAARTILVAVIGLTHVPYEARTTPHELRVVQKDTHLDTHRDHPGARIADYLHMITNPRKGRTCVVMTGK